MRDEGMAKGKVKGKGFNLPFAKKRVLHVLHGRRPMLPLASRNA